MYHFAFVDGLKLKTYVSMGNTFLWPVHDPKQAGKGIISDLQASIFKLLSPSYCLKTGAVH
jgi:hypothetical protein